MDTDVGPVPEKGLIPEGRRTMLQFFLCARCEFGKSLHIFRGHPSLQSGDDNADVAHYGLFPAVFFPIVFFYTGLF